MRIIESEIFVVLGSSPHTWGRCENSATRQWKFTVHPHIRGVDAVTVGTGATGNAVHPHIRGVDGLSHLRRCRPEPVHPHIRGVDNYTPLRTPEGAGSSPHTWGRYFDKPVFYRFCIKLRPSMSTILCLGSPCISRTNPCSLGYEYARMAAPL